MCVYASGWHTVTFCISCPEKAGSNSFNTKRHMLSLTPKQFVIAMQEAARVAGRHISIIRTAGAGPDHPIDPAYPEGAYLKNVLLLVT